jgi:hypothetical protein
MDIIHRILGLEWPSAESMADIPVLFYLSISSKVDPCEAPGGLIPKKAAMVGATSTGCTSRWTFCASIDGPAKMSGTWVS